jgi:hypothetical protein
MVGRLARVARSLVVLLAFFGPALAQGALSGTLYAPDVGGYVVIACLPSLTDGCDEAGSGFAEIPGGGASAAWRIDGLGAGPYLVLAWRDVDGDGEADEDELTVLLDAAGEPALVAAPATGIALGPTAAAAAPAANRPSRSGPGRAEAPVAPAPAAPAPANPQPATPPAVASALPADLVGVWQMTRASAGDFRDVATGQTFSMTSGFSTVLKLRPDGAFFYQFYSSGVAPDCAFVSSLDTAVGSAAWGGGRLVLTPTQRQLEVTSCAASGTYDGGLAPMVYDAVVEEGFDLNQLRTWSLRLEGGPVPLAYTLLDRPPLADPPVRAQPADFVLGDDPPYAEVLGLWSEYPNSVTDFYDPVANTFYVPEYDATTPMWVRFTPGGYEMAHALRDAAGTGVCDKDLIYYERGRAQMVVLEDVGGYGGHFRGHVRFEADDARVIVQVSGCGPDDGVVQHAAPLATSYFEWTWWRESNDLSFIPEVLSLRCAWPYAEYQGLFCNGSSGVLSMRRRE